MLTPGTTIGPLYQIERLLGEGGMGSVYLAKAADQRTVAIKEIAGEDAEGSWKLFQQELGVLKKLSHPLLVRYLDTFSEGRAHYIVMEYIDGKTMRQWREEQQVLPSRDTVFRWALQLCEVLGYMHSMSPPVLFRDLKPANIMIETKVGGLKLIDFGIAREMETDSKTATFLQGVGSAGFAPVEQYGRGGTDHRADIYSLGATLYFLIAGSPPPPSVSLLSREEILKPLRTIHPGIPKSLELAIFKMLAPMKEARFQSIAEVAQAIQDSQSEPAPQELDQTEELGPAPQLDFSLPNSEGLAYLSGGTRPTIAGNETRPMATKHRKWMGAVAGLGILGSGLFYQLRPDPNTVYLKPDSVPGLSEYLSATEGKPIINLAAGIYKLPSEATVSRNLSVIAKDPLTTIVQCDAPQAVLTVRCPEFSAANISFKYNGQSWGQCVRVESGKSSFQQCYFIGAKRSGANGGSGLRIGGSATGVLKHCTSQANDKNGFQVSDQAMIILENCTSSKNGWHGFCAYQQGKFQVSNTTCSDNQQCGFIVSDNASGKLDKIVGHKNAGNGLNWTSNAAGELIGGKFTSNGLPPTEVAPKASLKISP